MRCQKIVTIGRSLRQLWVHNAARLQKQTGRLKNGWRSRQNAVLHYRASQPVGLSPWLAGRVLAATGRREQSGFADGGPGVMDRKLERLLEKVAEAPEFRHARFNGIASVNDLGDTPLHVVVRWGDLEGVRQLVEAGIEVNRHGERGYTPLHLAAEAGHSEIVQYLLEHGADPFARTEGDLPFTLAKARGCGEVCDLINEHLRKRSKGGAGNRATPNSALSRKIEELQAFIDQRRETSA